MENLYKEKPIYIQNINVSELVKVNRSGIDIGLFGRKGTAKSTTAVMISFLNWYINDVDIYSNIELGFPHYSIRSLEDFDKVKDDGRKKMFLGDDFEYWFESRNIGTKISKRLNDILIFWGKFSTSIIYTSKREMAISKSLRESTTEFWELELRQWIINNDKIKNDKLKKYLNFLYIYINRYDYNLNPLVPYKIYNIQNIVKLFDTKEKISPLVIQADR